MRSSEMPIVSAPLAHLQSIVSQLKIVDTLYYMALRRGLFKIDWRPLWNSLNKILMDLQKFISVIKIDGPTDHCFFLWTPHRTLQISVFTTEKNVCPFNTDIRDDTHKEWSSRTTSTSATICMNCTSILAKNPMWKWWKHNMSPFHYIRVFNSLFTLHMQLASWLFSLKSLRTHVHSKILLWSCRCPAC